MTEFFDTSVLIAAFQVAHERHEECHGVLAQSERPSCAVHTLAEFYSTTTGFPRPARLTPEEALLLVEQIVERLRIVDLTPREYVETIHRLAANRQGGGRTYDALLLACARKSEAGKIYTLNVRDFRALAPDLAERITTP